MTNKEDFNYNLT